MGLDFSKHFEKYEKFLKQLDSIFERMQKEYPEEIKCRQGCTDCCYALFDLHLVEALYLNHKFGSLDQDERNRILIDADKADRKAHKLKKNMAKASSKDGRDNEELLGRVSQERLRCPLLREDDKCALYEFRPATCRLYGLPLDIDGETHTCGKTGFVTGEKYPTVKMRNVHENLARMSQEMAADIGSSYKQLHTLLLPVSTALLTEFDAEYLGIKKDEKPLEHVTSTPKGTDDWVIGGGE
jgi:Fe-S-cluster containining protein